MCIRDRADTVPIISGPPMAGPKRLSAQTIDRGLTARQIMFPTVLTSAVKASGTIHHLIFSKLQGTVCRRGYKKQTAERMLDVLVQHCFTRNAERLMRNTILYGKSRRRL